MRAKSRYTFFFLFFQRTPEKKRALAFLPTECLTDYLKILGFCFNWRKKSAATISEILSAFIRFPQFFLFCLILIIMLPAW